MGDQLLHYRLPLSAVRVSGTLKRAHDTILDKDDAEPAVGVEIVTIGDPATEQVLKYAQGVLRDTTLGLERSEDGRLASTSSESSGQVAKVITAASGLVATGIGFAIAGVPGAALAATASADMRQLEGAGAAAASVDPDERKIAEKYRETHGVLADTRVVLAVRLAALTATVAAIAGAVVSAKTAEARQAKARELKAADAALSIVRSQLDAVDRHFATWRATTIKSRIETIDRLITLDEFEAAGPGRIDDGTLVFDGDDGAAKSARDKLRSLWNDLGLFLRFESDPQLTNSPTAGSPATNVVVYREPRWAILRVQQRDGKLAVTLSEKRYAILDGRCPHREFELRRSMFARKSSKVTYSATGIATGFTSGSTSSVAAFAESVGGIPGTVSSGLKSASEITDSVYALRNKALDNELTRVNKAVELRQKRILDAGLDVTEAQSAELDGLKQRQAMLEANKAILEAGDAIDDLRAPASPPSELAKLQNDVALLRLQLEKAVLQGAVSGGQGELIDVADVLRYAMAGTNPDS